jgi:cell division protein FtsB
MATYTFNRKPDERAKAHEQDSEARDAACFLLLVGLCVVVALLTTTFPNHGKNRELTSQSVQLKEETEKLVERNERLRAEIVALRSDKFYIEAVARRKYKLIMPGETLVEPAAGGQQDIPEDVARR